MDRMDLLLMRRITKRKVEDQSQGHSKKTKEEHLDLVKTQSEAFRKIHRNLREDEILLVMNFTAFGIPFAKSQFLYLNDLIVTIYEHGGKHDWINYVSTSDDKQMFDFVEGSLYMISFLHIEILCCYAGRCQNESFDPQARKVR